MGLRAKGLGFKASMRDPLRIPIGVSRRDPFEVPIRVSIREPPWNPLQDLLRGSLEGSTREGGRKNKNKDFEGALVDCSAFCSFLRSLFVQRRKIP